MLVNSQSLPGGGARIAEGDPLPPENHAKAVRETQSLERLYRARGAWLQRFFSRSAPPEEAQDLMHETFARLADADGQRRIRIAKPEAYLTSIAKNLLRDRAKTRARRAADLHISADDAVITAPDQLRALEARDMLNRLEQAMLKLHPRTREIFLAHRLDGFSYAEIAMRTGLSVKGVEKQMSRAIAQLDRLLGPR